MSRKWARLLLATMKILDFYAEIARALDDYADNGYDGKDRLDYWLGRLRMAADQAAPDNNKINAMMRRALARVVKTAISPTSLKRHHPTLRRYTVQRVGHIAAPLLEQRILAGVDLIRLNRDQSIEKVLQRFTGLVTSIPEGGTRTLERGEAKRAIGKSLRQMSFEERRVVIDQGHKLTAAIQRTVAEDGNAIAAIWHSHWRRPGYHYREDHKERDEKVYAIRGNWALNEGLMKAGPAGYTDEITQVGEEPFCSCYYQYIYNINSLPDDMRTRKSYDAA